MTVWRAIPSWPAYEASENGEIRRVWRACGATPGKILAPTRQANLPNYLFVGLSINRVQKRIAIHRLVCEAFHGPQPSRKHEVAHWDGDGFNNAAVNLRWATRPENSADKWRHGTMLTGPRHPAAILSTKEVAEVRAKYAAAKSRYGINKKMAAEYGVSLGCIEDIVYRRSRIFENLQPGA